MESITNTQIDLSHSHTRNTPFPLLFTLETYYQNNSISSLNYYTSNGSGESNRSFQEDEDDVVHLHIYKQANSNKWRKKMAYSSFTNEYNSQVICYPFLLSNLNLNLNEIPDNHQKKIFSR